MTHFAKLHFVEEVTFKDTFTLFERYFLQHALGRLLYHFAN